MSLLNDALKKAQNIQSPQKPGFPVPSQPVHSIATPVASHMPEPAPSSNPSIMSVMVIAGVVFIVTAGVLGVGGYFLFSKVTNRPGPEIAQVFVPPAQPAVAPTAPTVTAPPPAVSPPVATRPEQVPATASVILPPPPVPSSAIVPEPALVVTHNPVPTANQASEPVVVAPTSTPKPKPRPMQEPAEAAAAIVATVVDFPKAGSAPAKGQAESAEPVSDDEESGADGITASDHEPVEIIDDEAVVIIDNIPEEHELPTRATGVHPDPKIQSWVAQIEVSGVRMGTVPKVLMNDRVYTTGDFVDRKTRLKLTGIEERTLIFQDPDGNSYELYF